MVVTAHDAFDRVVDPIFRQLSEDNLRQLLRSGSDPSLDSRIEELAEKCNEGVLTPEEREEYEAYARAGRFVSLMQAQARKVLAGL